MHTNPADTPPETYFLIAGHQTEKHIANNSGTAIEIGCELRDKHNTDIYVYEVDAKIYPDGINTPMPRFIM